jgi:type I restriction enzyme M protein
MNEYAALLDKQANLKSNLKAADEDLTEKLVAKYPQLTEEEVKILVIQEKWFATLNSAIQVELDQVSQAITKRIRQLAERYTIALPTLTKELATLSHRIGDHLKKMGIECN